MCKGLSSKLGDKHRISNIFAMIIPSRNSPRLKHSSNSISSPHTCLNPVQILILFLVFTNNLLITIIDTPRGAIPLLIQEALPTSSFLDMKLATSVSVLKTPMWVSQSCFYSFLFCTIFHFICHIFVE